ncbi:xanthine dehydrogenase accessory factor [Methylobacillus rhizosphaerae]|uniref:Xanthine dehydrogenase accessory factor n=1 Tax=Methylobacillus rhizosphaerae TaxID=551994 RepID=A0A238ZCG4_9PROT|nr:XdhC family protein [Methylobacillus rhizosphaerae]SNR80772.1 xanthine dehydrogenase accessory factor [Methylobacillus rhizosphaerae]
MYMPEQEVLEHAIGWLQAGHQVHLCTVVKTWGSSPRLPGAMLAVRDDGQLLGSVSGGCIEDELIARARSHRLPPVNGLLEYGVSRDEAQHYGIPCGGQLQIFVEHVSSVHVLQPVLDSLQQRRLLRRSVRIGSNEVIWGDAMPGAIACLENGWFHHYFGPQWRLLIIGANQLGAMLASMAQALEFNVLLCDPREEIRAQWQVEGVQWCAGMPDDVVLDIAADGYTAIVAVTHDPRLDDMALLEALRSEAFYVGALGSRLNQEKRRERLRMFELGDEEISRLHGPVGLQIGSRTPAEIAVAILAEIIQIRSQQRAAALKSQSIASALSAGSVCTS